MPEAPRQKSKPGKINSKWLAVVDRLLIAGIRLGPSAKRDAINKILEQIPELTRGDCWRRIRHLRRTPELSGLEQHQPRERVSRVRKSGSARRAAPHPWTPADDDRLLNWAGYEPVKKIAHRLGRSISAVRFRIGALGMSAKVTDGWSLRTLQAMLRISRTRLRRLVASGMLRVRNPRITIASLAAFCEKSHPCLESSAVERVAAALAKGEEGHTWERAADLLGVSLAQVQSWISAGQLRVVDPFVTDRAFEEFCKKHGGEINTALMDRATAKWLLSEYGVTNAADRSRSVSRAQKHALVIRTCACGRKIAGNVYFRHVKICPSAVAAAHGDPSNKLEPRS